MLNYVNRVHVGLASGADNGVTTLSALGRGDMLVLDSEMTPITAAPADNLGPRKSFYIAVGTGFVESPFILSSPIFGNQVTSATVKATSAAADQVSTIGPFASPTVGDDYQVIVAFKDRQRLIANRQTRLVMAQRAVAGDSVYTVASALAGQAQFSSPYSDPYGVRIDITGVTGTVTVSDNDATVTKNSKSVPIATAIEHDTGTPMIVGDVIVFDNISYAIASISGLVLTLDRAFNGTSGVVAAANVDIIKTATAATMTVTGVASPYNNPEIDIYEKPSFDLGGSENSGAVINVTASALGQGLSQQVKKMEFDVQSYLGNSNLRQWPIPVFDYHSVAGTAYNVYHILSQDEHEGDLQNQMKSPVGITLAFSNTAAGQENDITAILNPLIPGFAI